MSVFRFRATSLAILMAVAALPATAQQEQSPSQARMKATVRTYFEAMTAGDKSKARSLFSDDATIEDPFGSPLRPVDQFLGGGGRGGGGSAAKPSFDIVLITGTNTNTAAPAINLVSGSRILTAIELFTFKPDGKISSMKASWEREDVTQPATPSAAGR